MSLIRFGGDLLSHVLRRSTIGVAALNGRVREGIGCLATTMTTKPEQRHARIIWRTSIVVQVCTTLVLVYGFLAGAKVYALLFPDQIKPIGQLVPVS